MKDYKIEVLLRAPEKGESENCQDRIFALVDRMMECRNIASDECEAQNKRDSAIHEINYLARRLLFETGV